MNDPATEGRYTIGELADRADVTPRTIRYYTSEGVLPPPDLRGKYALYSEDHLRRLLLIKQLKDAFLPLQEIRARLEPLAPAEVADLLAREQPPGDVSYPLPAQAGRSLREESSAADYIAQLLSTRRSSAPAERAKQAPPPSSQPAPPGAAPSPAPAAPPPVAPAAPAPAPAAPPAAREEASGPEGSPAAETWQRIPLAPGLELHIRQPAPAEAARLLDTLLDAARPLLESQEDAP